MYFVKDQIFIFFQFSTDLRFIFSPQSPPPPLQAIYQEFSVEITIGTLIQNQFSEAKFGISRLVPFCVSLFT